MLIELLKKIAGGFPGVYQRVLWVLLFPIEEPRARLLEPRLVKQLEAAFNRRTTATAEARSLCRMENLIAVKLSAPFIRLRVEVTALELVQEM